MFFRKFYNLLELILISTLCYCTDYRISIITQRPPECKQSHWRHDGANTAIEINGIEIDAFQWRASAKSQESVEVENLNENWEFAGWADRKLDMPEVIEISEVSNFRGTPTIYIRVTPWRILEGKIEVLTKGEIQIFVDQVDFPSTYNHPFLLNGEKKNLQREYSNNTQ